MKTFRKILVANRGEVALRIMRTCRAMGIDTVAVYAEADKKSLHASTADEAVLIGPAPGADSYFHGEAILEAARRTGADAIHPGCGFLAENADFAAACETAAIAFIGPTAENLRKIGSKHWPVAKEHARERHIEVPILGDTHGQCVHLLERDCSIQLQHEMIIAESPSPAVNDDLRARLGEAAVAVGRELGACLASVEFLITPAGGFDCIGVQASLSLQHAVTEMITSLDLVRLQIEIAEGRPLPALAVQPRGHAIEARLLAQHLSNGFGPATGTIQVWELPAATSNMRIDAAVEEGIEITADQDPLLAKIIGYGGDRENALRSLIHALRTLRVLGVGTNQELLLQVLETKEFHNGGIHAAFLDEHPFVPTADAERDFVFAAALVLYLEKSQHARREILPGVAPHYRNNPYRDPAITLRVGNADLAISWRQTAPKRYVFHSGERQLDAEIVSFHAGKLSAVIGGIRRTFHFKEEGEEFHVHSSLGARTFQRLPRYSVLAMPPSTKHLGEAACKPR
jgi:acetyl/propionyl-CoA carboxylase alpha subunit